MSHKCHNYVCLVTHFQKQPGSPQAGNEDNREALPLRKTFFFYLAWPDCLSDSYPDAKDWPRHVEPTRQWRQQPFPYAVFVPLLLSLCLSQIFNPFLQLLLLPHPRLLLSTLPLPSQLEGKGAPQQITVIHSRHITVQSPSECLAEQGPPHSSDSSTNPSTTLGKRRQVMYFYWTASLLSQSKDFIFFVLYTNTATVWQRNWMQWTSCTRTSSSTWSSSQYRHPKYSGCLDNNIKRLITVTFTRIVMFSFPLTGIQA